jgi:hypothetical protein
MRRPPDSKPVAGALGAFTGQEKEQPMKLAIVQLAIKANEQQAAHFTDSYCDHLCDLLDDLDLVAKCQALIEQELAKKLELAGLVVVDDAAI